MRPPKIGTEERLDVVLTKWPRAAPACVGGRPSGLQIRPITIRPLRVTRLSPILPIVSLTAESSTRSTTQALMTEHCGLSLHREDVLLLLLCVPMFFLLCPNICCATSPPSPDTHLLGVCGSMYYVLCIYVWAMWLFVLR